MTLCTSSLDLSPLSRSIVLLISRLSPAPCVTTERCILILLRVSSASLLLLVCPQTTIFVSSYTYMSYAYMSPSVSLPLHIGVLYYCMCPRTTACALILLYVSSRASLAACVLKHCICVLMLPYYDICVISE